MGIGRLHLRVFIEQLANFLSAEATVAGTVVVIAPMSTGEWRESGNHYQQKMFDVQEVRAAPLEEPGHYWTTIRNRSSTHLMQNGVTIKK
jgi:hypothetical protein